MLLPPHPWLSHRLHTPTLPEPSSLGNPFRHLICVSISNPPGTPWCLCYYSRCLTFCRILQRSLAHFVSLVLDSSSFLGQCSQSQVCIRTNHLGIPNHLGIFCDTRLSRFLSHQLTPPLHWVPMWVWCTGITVESASLKPRVSHKWDHSQGSKFNKSNISLPCTTITAREYMQDEPWFPCHTLIETLLDTRYICRCWCCQDFQNMGSDLVQIQA